MPHTLNAVKIWNYSKYKININQIYVNDECVIDYLSIYLVNSIISPPHISLTVY